MAIKLTLTSPHPILFYTTGVPGSGKTSFSLQLAESLGAVHLYADKLGIEIFHEPKFSDEERKVVLEEMDWQAINYLRENATVVYDANNNRYIERERLRNMAKKTNVVAVGIWIKTPVTLAKNRVKKVRKIGNVNLVYIKFRNQSDKYFQKLFEDFENPIAGEKIITIPGTIPYHEQLKYLKKQMAEIDKSLQIK